MGKIIWDVQGNLVIRQRECRRKGKWKRKHRCGWTGFNCTFILPNSSFSWLFETYAILWLDADSSKAFCQIFLFLNSLSLLVSLHCHWWTSTKYFCYLSWLSLHNTWYQKGIRAQSLKHWVTRTKMVKEKLKVFCSREWERDIEFLTKHQMQLNF